MIKILSKVKDFFSKKNTEIGEKIGSFENTIQNLKKSLYSLNIFRKKIDTSTLESIQDSLITADVNVNLVEKIIKQLEKTNINFSEVENKDINACDLESIKEGDFSEKQSTKPSDLKQLKSVVLKDILVNILSNSEGDLLCKSITPIHIILVVGVNGNGKTTTVAKIANNFKSKGHSVRIVAADTYRAAAVEQLKYWADKLQIDFTSKENADPASVVFDGYKAAIDNDNDVLIIDTAGRLHNNTDLMNELVKIKNVVIKAKEKFHHVLCEKNASKMITNLEECQPFLRNGIDDNKSSENEKCINIENQQLENFGNLQSNIVENKKLQNIKSVESKCVTSDKLDTVFILDALTGQVANTQSKIFFEKLQINHIVITKLDCTASAGTIFSIFDEYKIPISCICFGEGIDDIARFNKDEFVKNIIN